MAARASWLAALLLLAALPAHAASTFSASVDRVEIDGNVFGPKDGVPDVVDEFDDGVIGPDWHILVGSATEEDGVLKVHSPGFDVTFVPGVILHVSEVENDTACDNGAGDFTTDAYYVSGLPALGQQIHYQLYSLGNGVESAGINITQSGPPTRYTVSQDVTFLLGAVGTPQHDEVDIDPDSATGAIIMRMAFDDASDTVTTSYSLNGGATFHSPFPPMHVFQANADGELMVGSSTAESTGPPPGQNPRMVAIKSLALKNSNTPSQRRFSLQINDQAAGIPGATPAAGATLNVDFGGNTQCFRMPAQGWTVMNAGYKYSDNLGLYGPVKRAIVKRTRSAFQAKITALGKLDGGIAITPPGPGVPGYTNLKFGSVNSAVYCGSTAGGSVKPNTPKVYKVKNAPAPPSCAIPTCSPSGAFLDGEGF
jgi:hypothetical protein